MLEVGLLLLLRLINSTELSNQEIRCDLVSKMKGTGVASGVLVGTTNSEARIGLNCAFPGPLIPRGEEGADSGCCK
jgi:hypothetical protein